MCIYIYIYIYIYTYMLIDRSGGEALRAAPDPAPGLRLLSEELK